MSSLSQQLARLRGVEKDSHLRASFLFAAKEAAHIDNDTVHSLAINGILELSQLDQDVAKVEGMLVGQSYSHFNDRMMMTQAEIQALDEDLSATLLLLSPYFLLKPTHKILEFLIRKYRIHEFSVDLLLESILPFHETVPFARMVQILIIKGTAWQFLEGCKKSGAVVPRVVLVQAALSSTNLMQRILKVVSGVQEHINDIKKGAEDSKAKYNTRFLSFFSALMMDTMGSNDRTSESFVRMLGPVLLNGIKCTSSWSMQAACCMICCRLSAVVVMKDTLTKLFLLTIAKMINQSDNLSRSQYLLATMLCIYENYFSNANVAAALTKDSNLVDQSILKHLCQNENLLAELLSGIQSSDLTNPLDTSGDGGQRITLTKSANFATAILCGLASHGFKNTKYLRVLLQLVDVAQLHPSINVSPFLQSVFARFPADRAANGNHDEAEVLLQRVALRVANRYPSVYEQELSSLLGSDLSSVDESSVNFQTASFFGSVFTSASAEDKTENAGSFGSLSRFTIVPGAKTTLHLALQHPSDVIRIQAIHTLLGTLDPKSPNFDAEQAEGNVSEENVVMLQLLNDDNSQVVKLVVTSDNMRKYLVRNTPTDKLCSTLLNVVGKWTKMMFDFEDSSGDSNIEERVREYNTIVESILLFLAKSCLANLEDFTSNIDEDLSPLALSVERFHARLFFEALLYFSFSTTDICSSTSSELLAQVQKTCAVCFAAAATALTCATNDAKSFRTDTIKALGTNLILGTGDSVDMWTSIAKYCNGFPEAVWAQRVKKTLFSVLLFALNAEECSAKVVKSVCGKEPKAQNLQSAREGMALTVFVVVMDELKSCNAKATAGTKKRKKRKKSTQAAEVSSASTDGIDMVVLQCLTYIVACIPLSKAQNGGDDVSGLKDRGEGGGAFSFLNV
jgi:hypothetical protein